MFAWCMKKMGSKAKVISVGTHVLIAWARLTGELVVGLGGKCVSALSDSDIHDMTYHMTMPSGEKVNGVVRLLKTACRDGD
jgi:hypothetical protein